MKEIHSQLCPVKRQKTLANAEADKLKRLATSRVATQVQSTQTASNAGPRAAAEVAPAAVASAGSAPSGGGGGGSGQVKPGNTTVSLTGTGTDHAAAEGPIDMGFKSKRQPAGKFQGIEVWGPYDAPGQLGIWGTDVCVDFDICISDGACIDACPVNVYEWLDTPGHPASEKKPFMIREKDCIFCLACENVCPPQAIKIFVK
jgi:ferredoxin